MSKINMKRAIEDARNKYGYYGPHNGYSAGSALDLAVSDQMKEIWAVIHPGDRYPDIAEITGNTWQETTYDDYDRFIKIDATYALYDNNGGSVVLKLRKGDK